MCWKATFSEKLILKHKQSIKKNSDITVREVKCLAIYISFTRNNIIEIYFMWSSYGKNMFYIFYI